MVYHLSHTDKVMPLQKFKANQIFKAIQSVGLNPNEFEFKDSGAEVRLEHKWSKSCFVFGGNAEQYVGHCVIGDAIDFTYDVSMWEIVMMRFGRWVQDIKDDLGTPDLWAEFGSGNTLRHSQRLLSNPAIYSSRNGRLQFDEF
jgi:hypothetical protein